MEYNHAYYGKKVCAVTGAASGIGLALCEELLGCGATVTLADFHKKNLETHTARLEKQYPGKVKGVLCNVTIEDDVKQMVDEAAAFGGGKLDLLINCAGAAWGGKFTEEPGGLVPGDHFRDSVCTNDAWHKAFALNFFGAVYGCRVALPVMAKRESGQIVNIISGIAFNPMAYQSMYAVTKSALSIFTSSLRYEYAMYGVKLNAATPGTTATAIFTSNDLTIPPEAQSPHASAQRILCGAAKNERVIIGDDADMEGGTMAFMPDACGQMMDQVYLGFARQRQQGKLSFVVSDVSLDKSLMAKAMQVRALVDGLEFTKETLDKIKGYIAERDNSNLNKDYYSGKTATITGAASGVGLALAEKLLECGAKKVVLADCNQDDLNKHVERLATQYSGKVKGVLCDVADEENVKNMIAVAQKFFAGSFDLLLNCAGETQQDLLFVIPPDIEAAPENSGIKVVSHEEWDRVFAVNFYGPLYGCRAVLPIMLAQKSGQVVNIISGSGFAGMAYESLYASTKAALNLLTLVLRYEYWDAGVRFNSATPGTTATPMLGDEHVDDAQTPEQSALHILTGVARNDRVIYGDNSDLLAAMLCYNEKANETTDKILIDVAKATHNKIISHS